ncbi:Ig-like domain-containing protein [Sphingomonas aerolata]|uniref:Ig-like domain-containing protein n=1 Tax=Sphingomonas aerolata TaxID=185951 RepID=UPI002FE04DDA
MTGTGEPGAQIVVRDLAGTTIGIAQVGVDGQYGVLLDPAQANGERLAVIQTDAAGNAASPLSLIAPDVTAPAAPARRARCDGDDRERHGQSPAPGYRSATPPMPRSARRSSMRAAITMSRSSRRRSTAS